MGLQGMFAGPSGFVKRSALARSLLAAQNYLITTEGRSPYASVAITCGVTPQHQFMCTRRTRGDTAQTCRVQAAPPEHVDTIGDLATRSNPRRRRRRRPRLEQTDERAHPASSRPTNHNIRIADYYDYYKYSATRRRLAERDSCYPFAAVTAACNFVHTGVYVILVINKSPILLLKPPTGLEEDSPGGPHLPDFSGSQGLRDIRAAVALEDLARALRRPSGRRRRMRISRS